jgi:hypothetical protein
MSDSGAQPQAKPIGDLGRGDQGTAGPGASQHGGSGTALSYTARPNAGVVIRATVEHIGVAGDTELTVNVKWPASTFSVQPSANSDAQPPDEPAQLVPSNGPSANNFDLLFGESGPDPGPAHAKASHQHAAPAAENALREDPDPVRQDVNVSEKTPDTTGTKK